MTTIKSYVTQCTKSNVQFLNVRVIVITIWQMKMAMKLWYCYFINERVWFQPFLFRPALVIDFPTDHIKSVISLYEIKILNFSFNVFFFFFFFLANLSVSINWYDAFLILVSTNISDISTWQNSAVSFFTRLATFRVKWFIILKQRSIVFYVSPKTARFIFDENSDTRLDRSFLLKFSILSFRQINYF